MCCLKPQQFNQLINTLSGTAASEATAAYSRTSGSGTIAAGAVYARVVNEGLVAGTFEGVALAAGEDVELAVPHAGLTLPALAYDADGSDFRIIEIRP